METAGTRQAEESRSAAQKLLARSKRFTALVAFNDISALAAMIALREAGLVIPGDVSVMGFDDIEFASVAYPPLTTIRQPLQEMGATAAEILLRKLAKGEVVEDIRLRPELIMRSSTCPPYLASVSGARALASKRARQAKSSRVIHRSMGCHTIVLDVSSSLRVQQMQSPIVSSGCK
jgi:ABC-type sugar transport system substrate-binding protein